MLELLTEKISGSLEKLKGAKKLNEKLVNDTLRDIRAALLEADVDYDVAKDFIKRLRERIFSEEIKTHLSPTDMIIMSVYDELVKTLGGNASPLEEGVVMFVGLQGTGKTTTIGKLANLMKKNGRSVMTVSTDVRRPAAMLQLKRVSELAGVEYLEFSPDKNPVDIAKEAFEAFKSKKYDYLFLDTAGRLHIDNELMEELRAIKEAVKPSEVIYVADSMQGQEALSVAKLLTKL
jgi:Signal recognition particle GTPase